jgi:peroxiredoxin
VERLRRATLKLVASGQAGRAMHAGELAPSFRLPDADGATVSSNVLLANGPLVVVFFGGGWCPYCNLELQAFEVFRPEIERLGAGLVAVSMQTVEHNRHNLAAVAKQMIT